MVLVHQFLYNVFFYVFTYLFFYTTSFIVGVLFS